MVNESLWMYFSGADWVIKIVMLILAISSFFSWVFIFQRGWFLKSAKRQLKQFEKKFWQSNDLTVFYGELNKNTRKRTGLSHIFSSGFKEYLSLGTNRQGDLKTQLTGVERSMRIATSKEIEGLEKHLPFLASLGSVSPYIGLFGTVWGIMNAFHALSNVQQASISMVAPGISEALVATALGLFTAIPAVLAYNRYANEVENIIGKYEVFQEEFTNLLLRQSV
jgi:biopolymer transport protein TolQ